MKTYRAGIVGCGRIGCGFDDDPKRKQVSTHAGAYARTPGVELAALADVDEAKLTRYGEKFGVAGRYRSCREMLEAEPLDILSVCTLSESHAEMVRQAVDHGVKAVFCEKPIADGLAAADEMIRLCADAGVLLMIDHQRRFDTFHQEVRRFLADGRLGRVQQVSCYYTAGSANTGSHLFDLLRFWLGDVRWVQGRYSRNPSPNPQDANVDGWLGFADGPAATVQACDVKSYLIFEISILGTAGRLRVLSSGMDVQFEAVGDSPYFSGYKELRPAEAPVRPEGVPRFMLNAVAHLLECLGTGGEPVSSGRDGRAALEIILALRQSADGGGQPVELPLAVGPAQHDSR